MKKYANIINFARGCEPRAEDDSYLLPTLKNELELCGRLGLRSTVLLQYDALVREGYRDLCRQYEDEIEIGLWLEIVEPLCEKAGIRWNGRYEWDWKIDCNITVAYTKEERARLADAAFEGFREYFGYYPGVAGCWIIDAFTLDYINEKYKPDAFCVCRDQYGTDGMTLWGGVYNGGYYPSKKNMIVPARERKDQIDLPVFRMLGPDPLYQYDIGLGSPEERQGVSTLEPVYPYGGGSEKWVDWYFRENYGNPALSHAYAQFGQENSFGWDDIGGPLEMQLKKLREKEKSGGIEVLTLGETGRRFKAAYDETPVNSLLTLTDWKGEGNKGLWYYSKYYRVNVYSDGKRVWIRDLQLYSDDFEQDHLNTVCKANRCAAFALPVIDGFRFSQGSVRAGLYPCIAGEVIKTARFNAKELDERSIRLDCSEIGFTLLEDRIVVDMPAEAELKFVYADLPYIPYKSHDEKMLRLNFSGFDGRSFDYELKLEKGSYTGSGSIKGEDGEAILLLKV